MAGGRSYGTWLVSNALGAPQSFTHEGRNLAEQHNLFRTADGHVHALWFNFDSGWHHEDRTLK